MDAIKSAIDQMKDYGLIVDGLQFGRRIRVATKEDRPPQKTGWYVAHQHQGSDGAILIFGSFGDWRRPGDWQKITLAAKVSAEERAAFTTRVAEDKKREEIARKGRAKRAAERADRYWRKIERQDGSAIRCAYLEEKQVNAYGARISARGNLVVPVRDIQGRMRGLQIIYADGPNEKGRRKEFWPFGMDPKEAIHLIGEPKTADWMLVCEGYATGASLHEATGLPVAVAFSCGALFGAAKILHDRYPEQNLLFCADDDFLTEGNPGVRHAKLAALAVGGHIAVPVFSAARSAERKLTDFNDLHVADGLPAVRRQIESLISALSPAPEPSAKNPKGEGAVLLFGLDDLLRDFSLIYGSEGVFDHRRREVVSLKALRAAAPGAVRFWLEHPDRKIVVPEDVNFDPGGDSGYACNLWNGFPSSPKAGRCDRTLELLEYLCSREETPADPGAVYRWMLRWLAYPLQHHGAKLQTAVLMHGEEGGGKNLFFGAILDIYQKYGVLFSQQDLESQWNDIFSGKLFAVGNEVVSRAELYHLQGTLKHMITDGKWPIRTKFLPTRIEGNHCNFIFFSNRLDIAKLDRKDRRYCVIYTPPELEAAFYIEVANELKNGGVEALHDYLLKVDTSTFSEHTKPPMTEAKKALIELSLDSPERFWLAWSKNDLPIPFAVARSEQVYEAYRFFCQKHGVAKPAPLHILIASLGQKAGVKKERNWYLRGASQAQATVLWPDPKQSPTPGFSQAAWLGEQIQAFSMAFDDWRGGIL